MQPVDSSEEGAPVPELITLSVLGEPLVDSLQEPMPAAERLEYAIQATALIWEPLERMRYVVSDDVNFDYFGMAPWDAVGIHGDIPDYDVTVVNVAVVPAHDYERT